MTNGLFLGIFAPLQVVNALSIRHRTYGKLDLATYENCQGTLQCYRALDGSELCFPRCLGNPCFWV